MNDGVIYLHIHTDFSILDMQTISDHVRYGNKRYVRFTSGSAMLNAQFHVEPCMFETAEMTAKTLDNLRHRAYVEFRKY